MVFSSTIFLFLFLPIVVLIYYSPWSKNRTFRNRFLLFASLVFYAWGELAFLLIMLFSITVGWYAALQLEKAKTKERRKKNYCNHHSNSYFYIVYFQISDIYIAAI